MEEQKVNNLLFRSDEYMKCVNKASKNGETIFMIV